MSEPLSQLRFHHMGLAVRDDRAALAMVAALGLSCGPKIFDPIQNVHVRLCTSDHHPAIEIVQPGEGKSPIDRIINRYNELIYHICYEVADRAAVLAAIEQSGLRMLTISDPKPAVLFGGREVSFHQVAGFGIIELLAEG